jgi:hypothetical protein
MSDPICEIHGPYSADLGSCPFCKKASGKPHPPLSLEDDMPTYVGRGTTIRGVDEDDDQTQMPRKSGGRSSIHRDQDDDDGTIVDRPQSGLLGWLVVKSGGAYGHMYKIRSGAVIGRDMRKADVVIDDEKISGIHAKINIKNGQFLLWDLGSSNGTYVNGQEIESAVPIKENDEIRMGKTVFILKTLGQEKAVADQG